MARRRFDLLRAVFWLLALVMGGMMVTSVLAGVLCWWTNYTGPRIPEACKDTGVIVRDLYQEMLTAILALLLASRPPPAPPPDEPDE